VVKKNTMHYITLLVALLFIIGSKFLAAVLPLALPLFYGSLGTLIGGAGISKAAAISLGLGASFLVVLTGSTPKIIDKDRQYRYVAPNSSTDNQTVPPILIPTDIPALPGIPRQKKIDVIVDRSPKKSPSGGPELEPSKDYSLLLKIIGVYAAGRFAHEIYDSKEGLENEKIVDKPYAESTGHLEYFIENQYSNTILELPAAVNLNNPQKVLIRNLDKFPMLQLDLQLVENIFRQLKTSGCTLREHLEAALIRLLEVFPVHGEELELVKNFLLEVFVELYEERCDVDVPDSPDERPDNQRKKNNKDKDSKKKLNHSISENPNIRNLIYTIQKNPVQKFFEDPFVAQDIFNWARLNMPSFGRGVKFAEPIYDSKNSNFGKNYMFHPKVLEDYKKNPQNYSHAEQRKLNRSNIIASLQSSADQSAKHGFFENPFFREWLKPYSSAMSPFFKKSKFYQLWESSNWPALFEEMGELTDKHIRLLGTKPSESAKLADLYNFYFYKNGMSRLFGPSWQLMTFSKILSRSNEAARLMNHLNFFNMVFRAQIQIAHQSSLDKKSKYKDNEIWSIVKEWDYLYQKMLAYLYQYSHVEKIGKEELAEINDFFKELIRTTYALVNRKIELNDPKVLGLYTRIYPFVIVDGAKKFPAWNVNKLTFQKIVLKSKRTWIDDAFKEKAMSYIQENLQPPRSVWELLNFFPSNPRFLGRSVRFDQIKKNVDTYANKVNLLDAFINFSSSKYFLLKLKSFTKDSLVTYLRQHKKSVRVALREKALLAYRFFLFKDRSLSDQEILKKIEGLDLINATIAVKQLSENEEYINFEIKAAGTQDTVVDNFNITFFVNSAFDFTQFYLPFDLGLIAKKRLSHASHKRTKDELALLRFTYKNNSKGASIDAVVESLGLTKDEASIFVEAVNTLPGSNSKLFF